VSLISAAAINYLGAMTEDYRKTLINDWKSYCNKELGLLVIDSFDLTKDVVSQNVVRSWVNQKLPDDQYSIENGVFLKYSIRWPLLIDPQNQAVRWIREMEGKALKMSKADDPLVFRALEQAIRLGQPILIENVTEFLDPVLDSVLKKEILVRGAQKIIKLGDIEVEYNDSFRLFLVTSLPNPHYLPSAFIKVNLINFTITFKCLFEQLLSQVVSKERPELEKERTLLMESITKDALTLRELEDKSLTILSQSETSTANRDTAVSQEEKTLLDDQNLIDVLKQSKLTSQDIQVRLKKNEETEKNLNLARQKYSAIATRASILFFSVQNLASLNVMYQFSLNWFYTIFQSCLGQMNSLINDSFMSLAASQHVRSSVINLEDIINSAKAKSADRSTNRPVSAGSTSTEPYESMQAAKVFNNEDEFQEYIESVLMHLTYTVYQVVSWALFAKHKMIFSFSLSLNILKHALSTSSEKITKKDYNFFLNSALMADMNQEALSNKILKLESMDAFNELIIDDKKLRQMLLLEENIPDKFSGLTVNVQTNIEVLWKKFMSIKDPYHFMSNEDNWKHFNFNSLTKFKKLILIKLLRPDALVLSIDHFISETLGAKFLVATIPTLNDLYNQSLATTPIVFILSPGSDPTSQLLRYAKESRGSTLHLEIVSLGQGQGPRAEELIAKSLMLKGRWVFLQNCHLAASFMPRLQQIVSK
jgi:dynein heavy chain